MNAVANQAVPSADRVEVELLETGELPRRLVVTLNGNYVYATAMTVVRTKGSTQFRSVSAASERRENWSIGRTEGTTVLQTKGGGALFVLSEAEAQMILARIPLREWTTP